MKCQQPLCLLASIEVQLSEGENTLAPPLMPEVIVSSVKINRNDKELMLNKVVLLRSNRRGRRVFLQNR